MMGIYTNVDDPDTVIESYTFRFSYNKDGVVINNLETNADPSLTAR